MSFGTVVLGGGPAPTVATPPELVVLAGTGPQGPPGPAGTAGYDYVQPVAAATWTINHDLGYRPSVELLTTGGMEMVTEVVHTSVNQVVVLFVAPTAGSARLV